MFLSDFFALMTYYIKNKVRSKRQPIIFVMSSFFLQTVKSNILLSQNAGNAILDTLKISHGACPSSAW